jgi:hypothetical protein
MVGPMIGAGWGPSGNQHRIEIAVAIACVSFAIGVLFRSTIIHPQAALGTDPMKGWLLLGLGSLAISLVIYWCIYWNSRVLLRRLNIRDLISDLISHVPKDDSPAWPHILAGVFACLGTCLLAGFFVASLLSKSQNVNSHGIALTSGELVFAVLISGISFWTLCQTKRIELIQGSNIDGFRGLIQALTEEIEFVNNDFSRYKRARIHHRIYLVTTNPYFGLLSFGRDDTDTARFENALRQAARHVESTKALCEEERFKIEILCGAEETIRRFHETFYRSREHRAFSPNGDPSEQATDQQNGITSVPQSEQLPQEDERSTNHDREIADATTRTTKFITDLDTEAEKQICFLAKHVPKTQFAIIGNVVFEFILETPGLQTEIHKARLIREKIVCDRFVETFAMLRRLGELDV